MKRMLTIICMLFVLAAATTYSQVNFTKNVATHTLAGNLAVLPVDLDQDGDMDFVGAGSADSTLAWYRNDGLQNFTEIIICDTLDKILKIAVINFDSDTTSLDIVCLTQGTKSEVYSFINDGSQQFTPHLVATGFQVGIDLQTLDLEDDNDIDFIVTDAATDSTYIFTNDGNMSFTKKAIGGGTATPLLSQAIDINGDTNIDYLITSYVSAEIGYYLNDGAGNFTYAVISDSIPAMKSYAVDFDSDGDIDILAANYDNGEFLLYSNNGALGFTRTTLFTDNEGIAAFDVGNLDGDTYLDIILANEMKAETSWYSHTATGYKKIMIDRGTKYYAAMISDIDDDTRNDIVFAGTPNAIHYYLQITSLAIPYMLAPLNAASDVDVLTSFDWSNTHGADGYNLQISTSTNFTTPIIAVSPGESEYEIASLLLENSTQYFWRVQAKKAGVPSAWADTLSFTTGIFSIDMPVLLSPADSSEFVDTNATFIWEKVKLATSYQLQLSNLADMSVLLIDTVTADTTIHFSGILSAMTKYYWTVKALCPNDTSDYAESFEFTTAPAKYFPPTLLMPADTNTNVVLTPLMKWSAAYGAKKYQILLDSSATFATPLLKTVVTDTTYLVPALLLSEATQYFWKVRSISGIDTSAWSSNFSFTTKTVVIAPPVLLLPINNAQDLDFTAILEWEADMKATEYRLQVSTIDTFAITLLDTVITTGTKCQISNLNRATKYFWRAKSQNASDTTDWSATRAFTTKANVVITAITGFKASDIAATWINGDGNKDIVASSEMEKVAWFAGDGNLGLTKNTIAIADTNTNTIRFGNGDNDGEGDILVTSKDDHFVKLLTWSPGTVYTPLTVFADSVTTVAQAEFFGMGADGYRDIIYMSNEPAQLVIAKYDSAAKVYNYTVINDIDIDNETMCFNVVDFNNDGKLDVLIPSNINNRFITLIQDVDGAFIRSELVNEIDPVNDIITLDIDGDSDIDIITASAAAGKISLFKNDGAMVFEKVEIMNDANEVKAIKVADYDNDGDMDIIAAIFSDNRIELLKNIGNEIFERNTLSQEIKMPNTLVLVDMDNDNDLDVVVGSQDDGTISIIENILLAKPILLTPADSSANVSVKPTFDWEDVKDAHSYVLQMGVDANFANLPAIITMNVTNSTSTYSSNELEYSKRYFWRVKASDGLSQSDWSEVRTFETEALEIAAPTLLLPTNNAVNITLTPRVSWTAVTSANNYILEISTTSDFATTVIEKTALDTTSFQIPANKLEYQTQYFWRVKATRQQNASAWSPVWSFTTTPELMEQSIALQKGWNSISLYINPKNATLANIFADCPELGFVQDITGKQYKPATGTNQIVTWDVLAAYDVFMNDKATLIVKGTKMSKAQNAYTLDEGLNYISYCFDTERAVEKAFAGADSNFAYIYNGAGDIFFPEYQVDCIGNLIPGQGYKVYAKAFHNFAYIPKDSNVTVTDIPLQDKPIYLKPTFEHTSDFCFVIVEANLPDVCEVVAFGETGVIVGSGAVSNNKAVISIYADDQTTQAIDGARTSELITLRAYLPSALTFVELIPDKIINAIDKNIVTEMTYQDTRVYHFSGNPVAVKEDTNIDNIAVYPMPINNTATLSLSSKDASEGSITIIDINGKTVQQVYAGRFSSGNMQFAINCAELTSGTYIVVVNTAHGVKTEKIIVK